MLKIKFAGSGKTPQPLSIESFKEDKRQGYRLLGSDFIEVKDKSINSVKEVIKELKKDNLTFDEINLLPMSIVEKTADYLILGVELTSYRSFEIDTDGDVEHEVPFGGIAEIIGVDEEHKCVNLILIGKTRKVRATFKDDGLYNYIKKFNIFPESVTGIVSYSKDKAKVLFNLSRLVLNKQSEDLSVKEVYTGKYGKNLYILGSDVVEQDGILGYIVIEVGNNKVEKFIPLDILEPQKSEVIELLNSGQELKFLHTYISSGQRVLLLG